MTKIQIEAKIEYQKEIGEVNPGSYRPIKFSLVKYKASPTSHIDIRRFQRGYDADGEDLYFPTKIGFQFPELQFRKIVEKYALMPESYVHPTIAKKCFSLLSNGEYDSAVIQAFKALETTTRDKICASSDLFGERLFKRAFNPDDGLLTNLSLPKSERSSFLNYITGAFSYYRNSTAHRNIELDFVTAFDKIVVASDLLKTIEDANVNVI